VVQLWYSANSAVGSCWCSIPAVNSPSCSVWVDGLLLRHVYPYIFTSVPASVCQPACESCNNRCTVHCMACRSVGSNASSKGAWPHTAANGDLARSSGSARAVPAAATSAAAAGSSVHSSTSEDVLGALQAKAAAVPSVWGSADQQQQQQLQRQQQGEQGWPDQAVADAQAAAAAAAAAAEEIGVRMVPSEVSAVQHLPVPMSRGVQSAVVIAVSAALSLASMFCHAYSCIFLCLACLAAWRASIC
jgi:hypothetical protein